MKTIAEAKEHLRSNFKEGTTCPCCDKYVKAYKRKLNSGIARSLITMYKLSAFNGIHIHVQDEFAQLGLRATTMDYAYAEKWKLIKSDPDLNGYWSITTLGVQFIKGLMTMPEYCLVYNGNVYKWSPNVINIKTALTTAWSYNELMNITTQL